MPGIQQQQQQQQHWQLLIQKDKPLDGSITNAQQSPLLYAMHMPGQECTHMPKWTSLQALTLFCLPGSDRLHDAMRQQQHNVLTH
jgi:hypothetical protein